MQTNPIHDNTILKFEKNYFPKAKNRVLSCMGRIRSKSNIVKDMHRRMVQCGSTIEVGWAFHFTSSHPLLKGT